MRSTTRNLALLFLTSFIVASSASSDDSQPWRKDDACGRRLVDAELTPVPGFGESYCVQLSGTARICACLTGDEEDTAQVFLERDGMIVQRWEDPYYSLAGAAALRVDAADLTGDGRDDLIVGILEASSNGMGIEVWTIRALTGNVVSNAVKVEDYGVLGFATRSSRGSACNLLSTRWLRGSEPDRGKGLYLIGQWYKLKNGGFVLARDRPRIYRRYLPTFERVRLEALSQKRPLPVTWYRDSLCAPVTGRYPSFN